MKQVVRNLGVGATGIRDVSRPEVGRGKLLLSCRRTLSFVEEAVAAIAFSVKDHVFEGAREHFVARLGGERGEFDAFQRLVTGKIMKKCMLRER